MRRKLPPHQYPLLEGKDLAQVIQKSVHEIVGIPKSVVVLFCCNAPKKIQARQEGFGRPSQAESQAPSILYGLNDRLLEFDGSMNVIPTVKSGDEFTNPAG